MNPDESKQIGRSKLNVLFLVGIAVPFSWTVYSYLFGEGFFMPALLMVVGLVAGRSMQKGARDARTVWILGGFFLGSLMLVFAWDSGFYDSPTSNYRIALGISGVICLLDSLIVWLDRDIKAFFPDFENQLEDEPELQKLIDEIGQK